TFENADNLPHYPSQPSGAGVGDFNGVTMQAVVRAWNTVVDEPGVLLHTIDIVMPMDAPIGPATLEFPLPAVAVLPAGRYLIAAVESQEPWMTLPLHTVAGRYVPGTSWVNWPTSPQGGWANVEAFGAAFAHPFRISAVLVPPVREPVAMADAFTLAEDG